MPSAPHAKLPAFPVNVRANQQKNRNFVARQTIQLDEAVFLYTHTHTHTFLLFTRSQCFGAQATASGWRDSWGRWLSEKVAEEGRISVDIGCTGER